MLRLLANNHTQSNQPQEAREVLGGILQCTQLQQAGAAAECSCDSHLQPPGPRIWRPSSPARPASTTCDILRSWERSANSAATACGGSGQMAKKLGQQQLPPAVTAPTAPTATATSLGKLCASRVSTRRPRTTARKGQPPNLRMCPYGADGGLRWYVGVCGARKGVHRAG
jgi:hypothetical protein